MVNKMLKDLNIHIPNINERDEVPPEAIDRVVEYLAQTFNPDKIILFGSYGGGTPQPDSDVDLLVVMQTDNPRQMQLTINTSFLHPFGLDILVRTPAEIRQRVAAGDLFLRQAVTGGKIVYERTETPLLDTLPQGEAMDTNAYMQEWVKKAEGDFAAATELLKLQENTMADAICFHSQQCAEKYLKAYLVQQQIHFQRTHDLMELLALCDDSFTKIALWLQTLNSYSVETRYPGRFTTLAEAEGAVKAAETVREYMRAILDL